MWTRSGHRTHRICTNRFINNPAAKPVQPGRTTGPPDTVRALSCIDISRGAHLEAPLFARCRRAHRDRSPAADGLRQRRRQVQRQRQDRRRRTEHGDTDEVGGTFGGSRAEDKPDGVDVSLPKDMNLVFDWDKPTNKNEAAAMDDAANYIRAIYHGVDKRTSNDAAVTTYSTGDGLTYAKTQIETGSRAAGRPPAPGASTTPLPVRLERQRPWRSRSAWTPASSTARRSRPGRS